jgi:hypothetical protein
MKRGGLFVVDDASTLELTEKALTATLEKVRRIIKAGK